VVVLGVFWMVEEYASLVGRRDAATIAAHVDRLPRVTVMSPEPLDLRAEGVVEEPIDHPGGATRYRTSGLRLLERHGGKILLVHDGWKPGSGVVIMLEDSDVLQWQFSR
jgi:hypothetical protein